MGPISKAVEPNVVVKVLDNLILRLVAGVNHRVVLRFNRLDDFLLVDSALIVILWSYNMDGLIDSSFHSGIHRLGFRGKDHETRVLLNRGGFSAVRCHFAICSIEVNVAKLGSRRTCRLECSNLESETG